MKWRALMVFWFLFGLVFIFSERAFSQESPDTGSPPRSIDDLFAKVAQQVPDFGGFFFDQNGDLTVYLIDTPASVAEAAILSVFGSDDRITPLLGRIKVLRGQYGFLQLKGWYDQMGAALGFSGIVFTDIDESRNRLVVGVKDLQTADLVKENLTKLGIPLEAVIIEQTSPITFASHTLRSLVRPTEGGLQTESFGFCTLGFNAVRQGVNGFVTNSHCTIFQGEVDGVPFYQPSVFSIIRIGVETVDPPFFNPIDGTVPVVGACPPVEKRCRYSDSAFVRYDVGVSFSQGLIARPTGLGSMAIDHASPHFRIVAEQPFPSLGEVLNKVGRTTGWTQGTVTATCRDTDVDGTDIRYLCQDWVSAGVFGGDSGSPVFGISNSPSMGDVKLYGILWGQNDTSTQFVFSAIGNWNVELDLGPLDTCAPGFSPC